MGECPACLKDNITHWSAEMGALRGAGTSVLYKTQLAKAFRILLRLVFDPALSRGLAGVVTSHMCL